MRFLRGHHVHAWNVIEPGRQGPDRTVLFDLQVLDPAFRLSLPEEDIIRAIFAPLVNPKAGDVWGWDALAVSSIEQLDDDGRLHAEGQYRLHRRFRQMTAEDVKFSIERIVDPALESPYAGDWSALKEVEVKDKRSGLIHLKNNFVPLWTTTLPTTVSCVLSKKAMQELGDKKMTTQPVAQSGQYLLADWQPKQRTVLKRNPDWKHEPGGYDEIHIIPIEDLATAERGFEAGDLDYMDVVIRRA